MPAERARATHALASWRRMLIYADHAGSFYAREYGFPPVTGRLLAYLAVCDPLQQTIADLAKALLASRSAITAAVKQLEGYHALRRTRAAGDRVDHVSLNPAAGLEPRGFAAATYKEQAELAREGLELLKDTAPERRAVLEEAAALYDFLAGRLPEVLQEWRAHRDALRAAEPPQARTRRRRSSHAAAPGTGIPGQGSSRQRTPDRAALRRRRATAHAPPLGQRRPGRGVRGRASAVGLDYLNIHNRISEFTTSVLYDRGGTGWSDRAELPRAAAEVATELRDLLHAADVPGPYLLATYSLGGAYARRFAQLFPGEVAGLLSMESFYHPRQRRCGRRRW